MPLGQRPVGAASGPALVPANLRHLGGEEGGGSLGFVVVDFRTQFRRAVEGDPGRPEVPAGQMEAVLEPQQGGLVLLVDRILVQTTSTTPTTASFYLGQVAAEALIEYTGSGDIDVADEVQPLFVPSGSSLICRWRGASAGAQGVVRYQFRVARLTARGA